MASGFGLDPRDPEGSHYAVGFLQGDGGDLQGTEGGGKTVAEP